MTRIAISSFLLITSLLLLACSKDEDGEPQDLTGQQILQPGMVFALEPGVYDTEEGGVRLENDFLCTEQGVEMLSSARLIYL